jgi:hypothetical protein
LQVYPLLDVRGLLGHDSLAVAQVLGQFVLALLLAALRDRWDEKGVRDPSGRVDPVVFDLVLPGVVLRVKRDLEPGPGESLVIVGLRDVGFALVPD